MGCVVWGWVVEGFLVLGAGVVMGGTEPVPPLLPAACPNKAPEIANPIDILRNKWLFIDAHLCVAPIIDLPVGKV